MHQFISLKRITKKTPSNFMFARCHCCYYFCLTLKRILHFQIRARSDFVCVPPHDIHTVYIYIVCVYCINMFMAQASAVKHQVNNRSKKKTHTRTGRRATTCLGISSTCKQQAKGEKQRTIIKIIIISWRRIYNSFCCLDAVAKSDCCEVIDQQTEHAFE